MSIEQTKIARTIQAQLFAAGKSIVWSWGANSWTALPNALAFKVHGFKLTGIVKITLMPSDTYTIELIKNKKVIKTIEDVYCDELTNVVDNEVEFTGAQYKSDVEQATYQF